MKAQYRIRQWKIFENVERRNHVKMWKTKIQQRKGKNLTIYVICVGFFFFLLIFQKYVVQSHPSNFA